MWNPFTKVKEVATIELDYKPSISDTSLVNLEEQFKGEVESKKIKFPSELGEEHPFDFKQLEELYKKFGFFTAVVDKYVDFVVGPGFYIECEEERAKTIIDNFMRDVNFDTLLRAWTKEALVKGNGFLEIGGSKKEGVKGLKVLNANYMYVVRDKFGVVEGYNQYTGEFDKFRKDKVIPFTTDQIAHVPFNVIGDCAYGQGIGYSSLKDVDNLLQQQKDVHHIMTRKANSPLWAQLGKVEGDTKIIPKAEDVTAFGQKMETMSNKTDWATDPLVNFKVIDFGNIGEKFSSTLDHDLAMLFYIYQIPPELMGMANIPEGMAAVRMDAFQRRIQSIQAELEKIIENQIFKRVLNANGLDVDIEFEWGVPSTIAVEGRMGMISELVRSASTSQILKDMLEAELVNLLKLDLDEYEEGKTSEEEARTREEERPQPIVPGQNTNFPQKVEPKAEQPKQPKPEEMLQPFIDILLKQEEKRNELLLKQQELSREDMKKKQEQDSEFIKLIISQMLQEREKENKIREEQKIENVQVPVNKKINKIKKVLNRTNLLPPFRIMRKTEAVEVVEEPKVENKIESNVENKVKWKNRNYEYQKSCPHCTEAFEDINDIQEWLGFNYKKYLGQIEAILKVYGFDQIKAVNEIETQAGYLSDNQIEKLRNILDKGFKSGTGMKEMAKQVDKQLGLKDLYRMTEDGNIKTGASGLPILAKSQDKRAIGIVRSEVTRLANKGAVEYYKVNDVANIKWLASFGDRTCPDCEALNGQIFKIGEEPEMPLHPLCRCTYAPVVELR